MTKRLIQHAARAAAFCLTAAASVPAQNVALGVGAKLETYNFADETAAGVKSVTLMTVPFGAAFRPATWLRLDVSGAYASGRSVDASDQESTIDGLTDTSIQLSVPMRGDRVTFAAAIILPTGKSTYTTEEGQVAGLIASDLFPFAISNWGAGGAVDLSTAVAVPLGAVNLGARVGYQVGQEFDLLEDKSFAYRPGNQLYARVAADGSAGAGRIAAVVTLYHYGDDEVNSQNLYRAGDRLQGLLSYTFATGRRGSGALYGGLMQRQHGVFLDGTSNTPSQTMIMLGGGLRQPLRLGILSPSVDVRVLRKSDGVAQGYIGGAGASLEIPFGQGSAFVPNARARFGKLRVREGSDTGLIGFEVGAGLRFGGLR